MRLATLLVALLLPASAFAQSIDAERAFDPQTGELVPLGFEAPSVDAPAARGGGDLEPVAYLPSGSTKLVRVTGANGGDQGAFFFQDGGSLVSAKQFISGGEDFLQDTLVIAAQPSDAVVVGDLAYIALRKNRGLLIVDVSDPANFEVVGQAEGRDLLAIAVAGDYAYAGLGTSGIVTYDVSDPANPVEVGIQPSAGSSNGAYVDGSTLYVAAGVAGLRTFDLTDPAAPAPLGLFGTDDTFATWVTVRDGVLWLTGGFGLIAVDVTDPASPTEIGRFGTDTETTYEVAFAGDTAFLPGLDGLRTLDVSDPADITQLALIPASQVLSVAADPVTDFVLFAERFQGLYGAEVSDPADPFSQLFYDNAGFAHKMDFAGDLLYITDLAGRLRIIDTSGDAPEEISRIDVPPNTQFVDVEGDFAYVADADFDGTGLTIVDVSDPADPQIVGDYGSDNQVFGLDAVVEDGAVTVYLANGFSGLVVLDATDPANIAELGSFPIGSNAVDVAVRDGVAYLVSFGGGMLTFDVTDPANIVQLDAEPTFGFLNAIDLSLPALGANYALVADGQQGLRVVDTQDPEDLVTIETYPTLSQARDVAGTATFEFDLTLQYAYVADDFFGLRVFDLLTSESFGSFESGDRGIGVATNRTSTDPGVPGLAALAAGEAGVYLFELPLGAIPPNVEDGSSAGNLALGAAFPNPTRDAATIRFSLPDAADATLAVYDVLGRRVATVVDGPLAAGDHEARVRTANLPSGVYLVRLDAGAHRATQRLVVVR